VERVDFEMTPISIPASVVAKPTRRFAPSLWLLTPGLLVLLAVFVVPLLMLTSRSVLDPSFTFKYYAQIFTSSTFRDIFGISFEISALTTVLCLLIGYPAAYVLAKTRGTTRSVLLGLVLLPFWTNILVRSYAWIVMLQAHGAINLALVDWLHLISKPLPLVFNMTGVMFGMVHYLLPPTILILDSTMRGVDDRLLIAAQSFGATPRQAFWRIFVPLTVPGIRAATILIFIMSLGFFVTPALLGGRRQLTIAMLINFEFTEMIQWSLGSALAIVLLVLTLLGLVAYYLAQPRRRAAGAGGGGMHG
jgi:putative spermidine/putrescine transport system permease protein